jgi:glucose/arabinose dehydrogenase
MIDFATGWDDGRFLNGRPAAVAFARDGRLFLGNDSNGQIIWIAPFELERTPSH